MQGDFHFAHLSRPCPGAWQLYYVNPPTRRKPLDPIRGIRSNHPAEAKFRQAPLYCDSDGCHEPMIPSCSRPTSSGDSMSIGLRNLRRR